MLKLTYNRKLDKFQTVTVIGDVKGIIDLYWQLTHNYKPKDGTEIGDICITNLDGYDCTDQSFASLYSSSTRLSKID